MALGDVPEEGHEKMLEENRRTRPGPMHRQDKSCRKRKICTDSTAYSTSSEHWLRERILLPRRCSFLMPVPDRLMSFMVEAGFGMPSSCGISFSTLYSFQHLWSIGGRSPIRSISRGLDPWEMVDQYFGTRPPVPANGPSTKEAFAIRMVWLRERLQYIPTDADEPTLRQLIEYQQPGQDQQEGRLLHWRSRLDRVTLDEELRFRWTPYITQGMQALIPDWMRSQARQKRQCMPDRLVEWYDGWRRRRTPEVIVTVHDGDFRGTQQYYEWRLNRSGSKR
ncbi:hypothetical protein PIB30_041800 [Stylosanthes scabra]|uniref:Uncharacterized protein n=1 Tax=Stylosanthes scabra TaxID=79078 RepID=A0ABU6XDU2_9FABA|nr:hypothetical protein [Stylosanthes scabra]